MPTSTNEVRPYANAFRHPKGLGEKAAKTGGRAPFPDTVYAAFRTHKRFVRSNGAVTAFANAVTPSVSSSDRPVLYALVSVTLLKA